MANLLLADGAMGFAGLVTFTGLAIVFGVLVLLILIFKLFGFIMSSSEKRKKEKAKVKLRIKDRERVKKAEESTKDAAVSAPAPSEPTYDGISDEVVAVISAAVAAYSGGKIRSIRKSKNKTSGRSAWANAGIADNTRPF